MVIALVLLLATPAPLPVMTVGEFLLKADALQKKGTLGLLSGDFGLLKSQTSSNVDAFVIDLRSAIQAHRPPPACPPRSGSNAIKIEFSPDELLAYFRSVPADRRNISSRQAFSEFMSRKYPCS